MRKLGCTLSGGGGMRIGKHLTDPTNGAHKNSDDQAMRSSQDPKGLEEKGGKRREKNGNSRKTRAREDPEHARIVRHKIRGCDVEHRLTFALADARSVRGARDIQRSGNSRIFRLSIQTRRGWIWNWRDRRTRSGLDKILQKN